MRLKLLAIISILFTIVMAFSFVYIPKEEYKLIWSDEFNKDGAPDSTIWSFENGFLRNHEDQWYQSNNAWCEKGNLIIEARKVHLKNPNYSAQSTRWERNREWINYTSSSLNTSANKSWLYGRFVMRARFDTSAGLWPAFWTLGLERPWPSNGEIDIMEYYKGDLLANVACGTDRPYTAKWFSQKKPLSHFNTKNWSNKFHIWRMDWDKNFIQLYVDDILMNKVAIADLHNADGSNPFEHPQYILLNLAIGGDNGGSPNDTKFPKRFEIDYVRVYQKQ